MITIEELQNYVEEHPLAITWEESGKLVRKYEILKVTSHINYRSVVIPYFGFTCTEKTRTTIFNWITNLQLKFGYFRMDLYPNQIELVFDRPNT